MDTKKLIESVHKLRIGGTVFIHFLNYTIKIERTALDSYTVKAYLPERTAEIFISSPLTKLQIIEFLEKNI